MSGIIGKGEVRRFYETATAIKNDSFPDGWFLELDGRQVKTPLGKTLFAPTKALAQRIADEWNEQGEKVIPATMPLTGLANAASDRVAAEPQVFLDQLIDYARSDLLCYWAELPDDLVSKQRDSWLPVLDWAEEAIGAKFIVTTGIIPVEQPPQALEAVQTTIQELDEFYLVGLVDMASSLGSLILAMAVWKKRLTPEGAYNAAFLDEEFQEDRWGEDHESLQRRLAIHANILSTADFLNLL